MDLTKKEQEDKVNMQEYQEHNKGLDELGQTVNETNLSLDIKESINEGINNETQFQQEKADGYYQKINNNETIKKVEKTAADISEQLSKEFTKAADSISNSINGVFRERRVNQDSHSQNFQEQQGQTINLNKDNQEKQGASFEGFRNKFENKYNEMNHNGKTVTPDKLLLDPVLAVIASLLICGLGQMINGQINKGLLMLAINVVQALLLSCCCGLGVITGFIGCILIAIDAYNCADALKQGESLKEYEIRLK